jgi:uncharacterized membrane protein YeaQ/YmgE (transglycosylase-associated protein family)
LGILSWILFGLIAGAIARVVMPGRDPGGIVLTILLGIGGAITGGLIAAALGGGGVTGFDPWSFVWAIGGALLLLAIYRALTTEHRVRA